MFDKITIGAASKGDSKERSPPARLVRFVDASGVVGMDQVEELDIFSPRSGHKYLFLQRNSGESREQIFDDLDLFAPHCDPQPVGNKAAADRKRSARQNGSQRGCVAAGTRFEGLSV